MPIRPARLSDVPIMARVFAATFGPDHFFQILFPYAAEYPDDTVTWFRRELRAGWWDYSKVYMVSYVEKPASQAEDLNDEDCSLAVYRNGRREIITGVCEWSRVGLGWESVWGILGRWDPRCLIKKLYEWRNKILYFFQPCRVEIRPTPEDPDPLRVSNIHERTHKWNKHLYDNPSTPWRTNRWTLEGLGIHPRYQGRGFGRELVQYGLARAKCDTASGRTGIPCVVTSSVPGEPFYQRVGFSEVVGYETDSPEWVEGINPMKEKGFKGGAVIWTWVSEDEDIARQKRADNKAEQVGVKS